LVKETGIPRENHRPAASHWQTLSCNVVSSRQTDSLQTKWLNVQEEKNCSTTTAVSMVTMLCYPIRQMRYLRAVSCCSFLNNLFIWTPKI
jgi:hypothetical protein